MQSEFLSFPGSLFILWILWYPIQQQGSCYFFPPSDWKEGYFFYQAPNIWLSHGGIFNRIYDNVHQQVAQISFFLLQVVLHFPFISTDPVFSLKQAKDQGVVRECKINFAALLAALLAQHVLCDYFCCSRIEIAEKELAKKENSSGNNQYIQVRRCSRSI